MHSIGAVTQSSVVLLYRAESAASCLAVVGGVSSEAVTADVDVDDGNVRLEVFGLEAGTPYDYVIYADGEAVGSGSCATAPKTGSPFSIAIITCWEHYNEVGNWVKNVLDAHDPPVAYVYFGGDTPYCNGPSTSSVINGETIDSCETEIAALIPGAVADFDYSDPTNAAAVRAVMDSHHKNFRLTPGVKKVMERYATLWAASDHEYPGNDIDRGDYTTVNDGLATLVANGTQQSDLMDICRDSYTGYHKGNPSNTSVNADSAFDENHQVYWSLRVNDDVELLSVENVWLRDSSPVSVPDRTLYGADQLAWLAEALEASTATFKIILSPTPAVGGNQQFAQENGAHPQTADGSDNGERDLLFKLLDNYAGVVVCSGDVHHSHISTHNGVTVLNACPLRAPGNTGTAGVNGYDTGARWWQDGVANGRQLATSIGTHNGMIGFVDVVPDEGLIYLGLHRVPPNNYRRVGYIAAGSNTLQFPGTRVA